MRLVEHGAPEEQCFSVDQFCTSMGQIDSPTVVVVTSAFRRLLHQLGVALERTVPVIWAEDEAQEPLTPAHTALLLRRAARDADAGHVVFTRLPRALLEASAVRGRYSTYQAALFSPEDVPEVRLRWLEVLIDDEDPVDAREAIARAAAARWRTSELAPAAFARFFGVELDRAERLTLQRETQVLKEELQYAHAIAGTSLRRIVVDAERALAKKCVPAWAALVIALGIDFVGDSGFGEARSPAGVLHSFGSDAAGWGEDMAPPRAGAGLAALDATARALAHARTTCGLGEPAERIFDAFVEPDDAMALLCAARGQTTPTASQLSASLTRPPLLIRSARNRLEHNENARFGWLHAIEAVAQASRRWAHRLEGTLQMVERAGVPGEPPIAPLAHLSSEDARRAGDELAAALSIPARAPGRGFRRLASGLASVSAGNRGHASAVLAECGVPIPETDLLEIARRLLVVTSG